MEDLPETGHGHPDPLAVAPLQFAHLRGLLHPEVDLETLGLLARSHHLQEGARSRERRAESREHRSYFLLFYDLRDEVTFREHADYCRRLQPLAVQAQGTSSNFTNIVFRAVALY